MPPGEEAINCSLVLVNSFRSVFGINGPEILRSQQMAMSSPSPTLVADIQGLQVPKYAE